MEHKQWTKETVVELSSRHIQELMCWHMTDELAQLTFLGSALRAGETVGISRSTTGFKVAVGQVASTLLLCKIHTIGAAWLSAHARQSEQLDGLERSFQRSGGFLYGGMILLTLLGASIALLNRDLTFAIFAVWMMTNLRLAAGGNGWDMAWLGLDWSIQTDYAIRQFTVGLYAVMSVSLFKTLFASDLQGLGHKHRFVLAQLVSLLLLVTSPFLPNGYFLPLAWTVSFATIIVVTLSLIRLLGERPNIGAIAYAASWFYAMAGTISEVIKAATGVRLFDQYLNSVTGALVSSLLCAIAIAQRMRQERRARLDAELQSLQVLQKFKQHYQASTVGLFTVALDGRLLQCNPRFSQIIAECVSPGQIWPEFVQNDYAQLFANNFGRGFEISMGEIDHKRWFELSGIHVADTIEGTINEVTERKMAELQLAEIAHYDRQTGVFNRHRFIELLEQHAHDTPQIRLGVVVLVDLDRFHQVVRYFGPQVGDGVLIEAKTRIARHAINGAILGRLSADTFALLLPDATLANAQALAKTLVEVIGTQPFDIQGRSFGVTARIGLLELQATMSASETLAAADAACTQAKEEGGNCVVVYAATDPQWSGYQSEVRLMSELRERIPFERLFLVFQPIVSLLAPQRSLSYEALLRLREKDGRIVSPGAFMPALEKAGLMSQVDRWVMREVFSFLERNPRHFADLSYASINLSGASLNDEHFLTDVIDLAKSHPETAKKICFEVTESVALAHFQSTKRFIDTLKSLGSRIALDDFGAGYSSFGYLTKLNVDYVKIDGSLIKDLDGNERNYVVVRGIVNLARELGMRVVAEWAENKETVVLLRDAGVNSVQGWAMSKPLEAQALLLAQNGLDYVHDQAIVALLTGTIDSLANENNAAEAMTNDESFHFAASN